MKRMRPAINITLSLIIYNIETIIGTACMNHDDLACCAIIFLGMKMPRPAFANAAQLLGFD